MPPDRLSILVDENVPCALESFGQFGAVRVLPGRHITPADVAGVDVLIVRSVTRVDEALLRDSPVRFVGTATIGCDHVDLEYLKARHIAFASAPGSNANSVAEYVTAALLLSARERETALEGATIAVIGVGNVGTRVVRKAEGLGMRCVLNDPPRRRQTGDAMFVTLPDALANAEYVTMHVPLLRGGPDRTEGMARGAFFDAMRRGAVFLNTSRGAVVDETALATALDSGHVAQAVLDVWQGEPDIDPKMVQRAFVATPHIAGYSFDGKVAATSMLYAAFLEWLGRGQSIGLEAASPPEVPRLDLRDRRGPDEDLLRTAVLTVYDIQEDDRALRETVVGPNFSSAGTVVGPNFSSAGTVVGPNVSSAAAAAGFDRLRKTYRRRREFHHTTLVLPGDRDSLIRKAACLGFRVETQ